MSKANELLGKIEAITAEKKRQVAFYDEQLEKLKSQLAASMRMLDTKTASYGNASACWRKSTSVEVGDWNAVMEFVDKNKAYDIIQRRIAPAALEKRLQAGEDIPGVKVVKSETFVVTVKGDKENGSES